MCLGIGLPPSESDRLLIQEIEEQRWSSCSHPLFKLHRTAMVTPAWLGVFPACTTTGTALPVWMPVGILTSICATPAIFLLDVKIVDCPPIVTVTGPSPWPIPVA